MVLQSSGPISVKQVATEFGTTNTMKAFYSKGGAVASGAINLGYFYGKSNSITASGGSVATISGYKVHYFYSSGTFSITNGTGVVEYLVVGGGGGSPGYNEYAPYGEGGGGGGGAVSFGTMTLGAGNYSVGVGAGASISGYDYGIGIWPPGNSGQQSSFNGAVASGGGGGGSGQQNAVAYGYHYGRPGGCGGGGAGNYINNFAGTGGLGRGFNGYVGNSGFKGADASPTGVWSGLNFGGGGGGAGEVGGRGSPDPRKGGTGYLSYITGAAAYYGGGGGAMSNAGGAGGGGTGTGGQVNTGGGAGSANGLGSLTGGSGIVIVRYAV